MPNNYARQFLSRFLFPLFVVVLVSGCLNSAPTPYQPKTMNGGYSVKKPRGDIHTVVFEGNGNTPKEQSSDFALLRAAELTQKAGFKYFAVINKITIVTVQRTAGTSAVREKVKATKPHGETYTKTVTTSSATTGGKISTPVSTLEFNMLNEAEQSQVAKNTVHNAEIVITDLKTKYLIK